MFSVSAADSRSAEQSPVSHRPGSVPSSSFPFPKGLKAPPRTHPAVRLLLEKHLWSLTHGHQRFSILIWQERGTSIMSPSDANWAAAGGALTSLWSLRHTNHPHLQISSARWPSSTSNSKYRNQPHHFPICTHFPHLKIRSVILSTSVSLTSFI